MEILPRYDAALHDIKRSVF